MKRRFLVCTCVIALASLSASADITQAQMQAAFLAALKEFAEYSSGSDDVITTYPIDDDWLDMEYYLSYSGNTVARSAFNSYMRVAAISNVVAALSRHLQQNFDVPLSEFKSDVHGGLTALNNSAGAIEQILMTLQTDLSSSLSGLSGSLELFRSQFATYTNQFADFDSDFADAMAEIQGNLDIEIQNILEIQADVGDVANYLYEIREDADTIAVGVGAIDNRIRAWIEDGASLSVEALANIRDVLTDLQVVVTNDITIEGLQDGFDGLEDFLADTLLPEIASQSTNVQSIADLLPDWFAAATNFYGGFDYSPQLESQVWFETNAIATNALVQSQVYDDELDSLTNELDDVNIIHEVTRSDDTVENPWDELESVNDSFEGTLTSALAVDDPGFSTELVLMGSNNQKLPRISFNVEDFYLRNAPLRASRSFFDAVYAALGVMVKFLIARAFYRWLVARRKA